MIVDVVVIVIDGLRVDFDFHFHLDLDLHKSFWAPLCYNTYSYILVAAVPVPIYVREREPCVRYISLDRGILREFE